ncbi:ABC transporter permease [Lacibacterium aquatile]|uniref:Autoinducer 2 import system permease protein LsrD n=1 Tax=Lacibacterium aquatile TaxID=1168082 RepID=A0ABW5DN99_9PROT
MIAKLKQPWVLGLLACIGILIAGELVSPGFAAPRQIVGQLTIAAILGVAAAGQTLVILGGREGIDLSVGSLISLGAFVAGNAMDGQNGSIPYALLVTCGATFLIGIGNGIGITLLRIPPLVMTLGTTGVVTGLLTVLTRGVPSGRAAPLLQETVSQPLLFGLPGILWIWAALGIALALVLNRTSFGLRLFAVGANENVARHVGIRVALIRTLLYGLSGFFAGLAGVLVLGYTGTVFVGIGTSYVLPTVIAVVIGGTALAGGIGGYAGTMVGALLLVLLQSLLTTLAIPPHGRQVIFGLTLLGLLTLYGRQKALRS